MLGYSYNNIIIVTNVVILKLLSFEFDYNDVRAFKAYKWTAGWFLNVKQQKWS